MNSPMGLMISLLQNNLTMTFEKALAINRGRASGPATVMINQGRPHKETALVNRESNEAVSVTQQRCFA